MKNSKVQFVLVAGLLMVIGVWLFPSMSEGKPKDSPWQSPENEREGYSRSFVVDANSVLFTVPEGRCYVLTRLYARMVDNESPNWWDIDEYYDRSLSFWTLTIDGEMFLDEFSIAHPYIYMSPNTSMTIHGLLKEDFPEKCIVVNSGQTLGITKHDAVDKVGLTLVGYFCDMP
ncbi:MAG: hypothetical protein ACYSOL_07565 [Planctomycetota bacterium]|jgi:hypothetical protein